MEVVVIGGGASGMMAALTAAQQGRQVCLLERQARVGRKLLATGNGRCNLSNLHMNLRHYHGVAPDFARPALEAFDTEQTLTFFRQLGLLTVAEPDGRVYPLSDQAGSVVDVMRLAVAQAGVEVHTGLEVTALQPEKGGFSLLAGEERLRAQKVIVCCGGAAGGKLGGTRSGYELLKGVGHHITPLYPALVQIKAPSPYVRALKGVRAQANIRLTREGAAAAQEQGEVQFTDFGVSGPAIFALSRAVSPTAASMYLELDFLGEMSEKEVELLLAQRQRAFPELTLENFLTGMLHNRLGRTLLRYAGYALTESAASLGEKDLWKIALAVKRFTLPVSGVLGFDGAQVTAGGARTEEFDPRTLQSRLVPGLYVAGEVLDIDGDCGGYNLQWAWSSGRLAGRTLP